MDLWGKKVKRENRDIQDNPVSTVEEQPTPDGHIVVAQM